MGRRWRRRTCFEFGSGGTSTRPPIDHVRTSAQLAYRCNPAYRVPMTTAAKLVWIVIAVLLVLALLNALALSLIHPG
jgi:hypothetical protein